MPLIAESLLDEIQTRADIAELIGRYVPLKRAGRHFKARCPFHQERTPSFHINTDKQIFHCFGCGVGGNIFSFLMQQERLTFPEAVRQVAERVGVAIQEPTQPQRREHLDALLSLLEKAGRYYERLLQHPKLGSAARTYLTTRGVTTKTREAFRLGCAPSGWDGLLRAAKASRASLELLEQAGLILRGSRGPVDRFRQRLMFPIQDVRGRIVGFGGRSLAGQDPKYLNSPETPVYSKGRQLFGLWQAKEAIVKANRALVVEGYFDCVVVWQSGCEHVVSPLGTAFTPEQARLLRRYTDQVVLAFDADAAGEAATLRGIDVLVEAGFQVHVAQFPAGVDPDEYVRAHGREAFQQVVAKALGILDFLLALAAKRYPLREADGKVQAAQFMLPTIAMIPNAMLKTEYVRLVAERLRLDEGAVRAELRKVKPRTLQAPLDGVRERRAPPTKLQGAAQVLTALLLDQPARWEAIRDEPFLAQISDERLRRIVAVVGDLRRAGGNAPTPAQVISRLSEESIGPLVSELVTLAQSVPDHEAAFRECIRRLRGEVRKRQLDQLGEQIRTTQQHGGQEQEMTRLLRRYQQVVKACLPGDTQGRQGGAG